MKYNTKSDKMRILISNLKGKALLNIAMKNGVDKLISVYSTYNETKLETTNAIEACQRLSEITRRAINEADEVYVATDGEFIGSILNFVANKEDVNSIYYYFNNQIIHMPKLSLNMSKTKLKILKTLQDGDQTAILIGKHVSISRSMVYKHINSLMEEGLVAQRKQYEKFYLTDAGRMLII